MGQRTCSVGGCDRKARGHGFCGAHYQRWRTHGDPQPDIPLREPGRSLEERFWARVDKREADECWAWDVADAYGYGWLWVHGRGNIKAHRLSWEIANGPIPKGMNVCHRCDNRICVNPAHLFLGTHADNVADMWAKERGSAPPLHRGERNPSAKLTDDAVRQIRALHATGEHSQAALARRFRVTQSAVWQVIHRKKWTHVTP